MLSHLLQPVPESLQLGLMFSFGGFQCLLDLLSSPFMTSLQLSPVAIDQPLNLNLQTLHSGHNMRQKPLLSEACHMNTTLASFKSFHTCMCGIRIQF